MATEHQQRVIIEGLIAAIHRLRELPKPWMVSEKAAGHVLIPLLNGIYEAGYVEGLRKGTALFSNDADDLNRHYDKGYELGWREGYSAAENVCTSE